MVTRLMLHIPNATKYRPLIASGLIDTLKKQWADDCGTRMEYLLRFYLLALLERPNSSIQDSMPMLLDKHFRNSVISNVSDRHVRDLWIKDSPPRTTRAQLMVLRPSPTTSPVGF